MPSKVSPRRVWPPSKVSPPRNVRPPSKLLPPPNVSPRKVCPPKRPSPGRAGEADGMVDHACRPACKATPSRHSSRGAAPREEGASRGRASRGERRGIASCAAGAYRRSSPSVPAPWKARAAGEARAASCSFAWRSRSSSSDARCRCAAPASIAPSNSKASVRMSARAVASLSKAPAPSSFEDRPPGAASAKARSRCCSRCLRAATSSSNAATRTFKSAHCARRSELFRFSAESPDAPSKRPRPVCSLAASLRFLSVVLFDESASFLFSVVANWSSRSVESRTDCCLDSRSCCKAASRRMRASELERSFFAAKALCAAVLSSRKSRSAVAFG
mmetsp:Transcript_5218/g.16492  ORF Transcript_5218/g.16492 Transcript_5218/m.16492 type:complete len:332 (+) Transcript_5218:65-1060(+)